MSYDDKKVLRYAILLVLAGFIILSALYLLLEAIFEEYAFMAFLIIVVGIPAIIILIISIKSHYTRGKPVDYINQYHHLLESFNVPEEHVNIVVSSDRFYKLFNCPAILWKQKQKLCMLVINKYPHVIERELPKRIKADILMSAFTAGDDFSYQPDYIKFYFAPYITVLHKKRIPYIDGRYEFGDFEVGVNCVYPIMKFFNIPLNTLDEYALKALINYGYIPKDAIEPDKQSLVESALSYNTYMEVQSELYKLKNSNIISGEELSMYLNNLREKQNELGYNGLVQPEPICEESGISTYEQMVEEKLNKEKLQKIKDKRFMSILLGGLGVLLIIILIIYLLQ